MDIMKCNHPEGIGIYQCREYATDCIPDRDKRFLSSPLLSSPLPFSCSSTLSRAAMGHTRPSVQWVSDAASPGVKLTIHFI
jgi:hypothetical protein